MVVQGFGQLVSLFLLCLPPSAAWVEPTADQLDKEEWQPFKWRSLDWQSTQCPRPPGKREEAFYWSYARPTRSEAKTTLRGVVWTFETDTRSGTAYPMMRPERLRDELLGKYGDATAPEQRGNAP